MSSVQVDCRADINQVIKDDPKAKKYVEEFDEKYLFIQTLIKRREELGLTQKDVAQRSGLTQPQVSRIETITHDPTLNVLWKYCKALDIKIISSLREGDK